MEDKRLDCVFYLGCACLPDALHIEYAGDDRLDDRRLFHGNWKPRRALPFRCVSGSRSYDLIGGTLVGIVLISDRVVQALQGFSGWSTYPVKLSASPGALVSGYQGLCIEGRCARASAQVANMIQAGQSLVSRLSPVLDPATWDGSDVFSVPQTTFWLVSRAVKNALEAVHATNVAYEEITLPPPA